LRPPRAASVPSSRAPSPPPKRWAIMHLTNTADGCMVRLKSNAVHFAIRTAAMKSTRVVGCGVRGRRL
jgi:hypothetical protein